MRGRILPHTGEFSSGFLSFLLIDIDLGKFERMIHPDPRQVAHLSIKKILLIASGQFALLVV
jgi:hypothetical protein